jgi:hypothetical protein
MNDLVIPFLSGKVQENLEVLFTLCDELMTTRFPAVFLSDMNQSGKTILTTNELYDAEADCYWCLCKVLDCIQENYTFAQPGVQKTCFHFSEVRCSTGIYSIW